MGCADLPWYGSPLGKAVVPFVTGRQTNSRRHRELSVTRRQQDRGGGLSNFEQIPTIRVATENPSMNSRAIDRCVSSPLFDRGISEPVHVRNPSACSEMDTRDDEVRRLLGRCVRDRDEHEELSVVKARRLGLGSQWPVRIVRLR